MNLTDAQIRQAFLTATGFTGPVETVRSATKGFRHVVWIVNYQGEQFSVKACARNTSLEAFRNEVAAQQLATRSGIPTAEIVGVSVDKQLLGQPYYVQRWLEGQDAASAMADMDRRGQEEFALQFAVAVASMHQVGGDFFAENVIEPGAHATWAELCNNRLERLVKRNVDANILPRLTIDTAEAYCKDLIAELPDDVVPALTHRDLYLPNVIVTPNAGVAIIDFEHASFFDRVWDFVKLEMWVFRRFPQLRSPFMDGYKSRSEWSRSCDQRLLLYEGIEYLAGVPYFGAMNPDERMLKDFLDLLSHWLPRVRGRYGPEK